MAKRSVKQRNLNIEVLRILAMFLIVACHATLHLPWLLHVDSNLDFLPGWKSALAYLVVQYGQVGVSIFFIISGYFLVRKTFTWQRIFKTWFQMFCYSFISLIAVLIIARFTTLPNSIAPLLSGDDLWRTVLWSIVPFIYGSYWFITAYVCLLLLAPFINCLFKHLSRVVPDVLRKCGRPVVGRGLSALTAWCHRAGTCPGSGAWTIGWR